MLASAGFQASVGSLPVGYRNPHRLFTSNEKEQKGRESIIATHKQPLTLAAGGRRPTVTAAEVRSSNVSDGSLPPSHECLLR